MLGPLGTFLIVGPQEVEPNGRSLVTEDILLKRILGLLPFLFLSYTLAYVISGFAPPHSVTVTHHFTISPKW